MDFKTKIDISFPTRQFIIQDFDKPFRLYTGKLQGEGYLSMFEMILLPVAEYCQCFF